ncbi:gamma-glutamyltransferase family protein [Nitrosopumilus maritimus]|uniref:Gamma-glutamyltransferase n=1 Tax=Nitrosopumilus maritimus (strain SCM1) TaxID=436308 RepID=A9A3G8_NITMS|nr:gamma-glutamyltransferase [Nitrosopumilus maritimus]ABX12900.1 Gamma-glutamyltransferase [Nitrosopumilus maritimus SCM1]
MDVSSIEKSFVTTKNKKCSVAKNGMVASAFPDATKAGVEMLKKGGNAVDAACATALALGVCEPQASGIGGQSMAILHVDGKTFAVDGSSRAPSLAHISFFEKRSRSLIGYKATTVPSTVATLGYLNERYGQLDWSTIVKPSIRIAKRGYRITKLQYELQEKHLKNFFKVKSKSGAKYFLKDGEVPYEIGDLFVQDDLAYTLEQLATYGYRSFYHGMISTLIDKDMKLNRGFLRKEDLALIPMPIERKVISRRYRGIRVYTVPPPGAGSTMLLVLMMLNNLPSKFLTRTPRAYHYVSETHRKALLYREQRRFNPETYHQIDKKIHLSRNFAKTLAKSIRDTIDPTLPLKESLDTEDTTHLSVMDKDGNAVGITQSIELVYGSKAAADGLGFLYNNYMSAYEFDNPNHPFYLRPNAIPWTSVCPSIIFYNHEPWMVLGTPGSARIFSTLSHFISRVIDHNNSIDQAMEKPRIHCTVDGKISLEDDDSLVEIIKHLKKMGYKIDIRERYSFFLGAIHAVLKRQTGDGFQGVAEVRRDGTAEGLR